MNEEEKQIMNKMIYCNLVSGEQALKFNRHIKQIEEENKELQQRTDKAMLEIAETCENCKLREKCIEEECILYRIEKILNGGKWVTL